MQLPWSLVRPEERQLTLILCILHFLLIALFTFSKIARDALFLDKLPASYLPYMYIALAVVSAGAVALLGRFKKTSTSRILVVYSLVVAVSFIGFGLWFMAAPGSAAVGYYLWCGIFGVGLVTEFWLLANESIDTRAARRLLGVIGASGIAGGLAAGFAATAVGVTVGPIALLFISAVLGVAAAFAANRTGGFTMEAATQQAAPLPGRSTAVKPLHSGYVRLLVLLFFLSGITLAVVDYGFKILLQDELTDGGKITSALGIFYSVQNLIALAAQLGLAGMLLTRFGGRPISNALPIGVLAAISLTLIAPAGIAYLAFIAVPLYATIMRVSLARSAWQFLYFPLPGDVRREAKRLIDILVNRGADAAAGAMLLGLAFLMGGEFMDVVWTAGVLCALWVAVELKMNREYPREVERALERQVAIADRRAVSLEDIASADELTEALTTGTEGDTLYIIDVLEILDPDRLREAATNLLRHSSGAIRAKTLAALYTLGDDPAEYADALKTVDVRIADDISVETGIADSAAERVIEAATAGTDSGSVSALRLLINDPNRDVRRIAYQRAVLTDDPELLREVGGRLIRRHDRGLIRTALTRGIAQSPERFAKMIGQEDIPLEARCALAKYLGGNKHPEVIDALYEATRHGSHRRLANAALEALEETRRADHGLPIPAEEIVKDLRADLDRGGLRMIQLAAAKQGKDSEVRTLIEKALRERAWQSLERGFRRLALIYSLGRADLAFRAVKGTDRHAGAQAIEYLDTHLPRDLRDLMVPVLEAPSEDERAQKLAEITGQKHESVAEMIESLLTGDDRTLKACALFVIGKLRRSDFRSAVAESCDDSDLIVRDTAEWAWRQLAMGEAA